MRQGIGDNGGEAESGKRPLPHGWDRAKPKSRTDVCLYAENVVLAMAANVSSARICMGPGGRLR